MDNHRFNELKALSKGELAIFVLRLEQEKSWIEKELLSVYKEDGEKSCVSPSSKNKMPNRTSAESQVPELPVQGSLPANIDDVKIGIITALPKELAAIRAMLLDCREYYVPGQGSGHRYFLGNMPSVHGGTHHVALALAEMGNNSGSWRSTLFLEHFKSISTILMVGIAGGVPNPHKPEDHVRLGDIVVSGKKGVIQYDLVKLAEIRACPVAPCSRMVETMRFLEAEEIFGNRPWVNHIKIALRKLRQKRPKSSDDVLHDSVNSSVQLQHPKDNSRRRNVPRIFSGSIASSNEVLKDPVKRDMLREKFGVKAVEMEGSGVADAVWYHGKGYLVVRGICDYCDTHKNDQWQSYAAIVAAAYTKALIESSHVY